MDENKDTINIVKVVIAMLAFFYIVVLVYPILNCFVDLDLENAYEISLLKIDLVYEIVVATIGIILFKDIIKKGFIKLHNIIKEHKFIKFLFSVIAAYLIVLLINYGITIVVSIISSILGINTAQSENQSIIENLLGNGPLYMALSACVFAPIAEEILFRGGLGQIIKNKKIFITVSGLIFGLMHITTNIILMSEILIIGIVISKILETNQSDSEKVRNIIFALVTLLITFGCVFAIVYYPTYGSLINVFKTLSPTEILSSFTYISMGMVLASYYIKYDNIVFNILLHALNNTISVILILFLL